jgi:hypothetical protein
MTEPAQTSLRTSAAERAAIARVQAEAAKPRPIVGVEALCAMPAASASSGPASLVLALRPASRARLP